MISKYKKLMKKGSITHYCYLNSPLGKLILAGDKNFLILIEFPDKKRAKKPDKGWLYSPSRFKPECDELTRYFQGELKKFSIKCHITGTAFQKKVLNELKKIPYGQTMSYSDVADRIDHPRAYRAVGSANGKNRLPIIFPCHRVISNNGKLGGFSGGLSIKRKLLELELKHA